MSAVLTALRHEDDSDVRYQLQSIGESLVFEHKDLKAKEVKEAIRQLTDKGVAPLGELVDTTGQTDSSAPKEWAIIVAGVSEIIIRRTASLMAIVLNGEGKHFIRQIDVADVHKLETTGNVFKPIPGAQMADYILAEDNDA